MGFDPDRSNPLMNNQVGKVVPPGKRANFTFSADANWENAVCIYPEGSEALLIEKGNYRRSLSDFSTPENNTGINQSFVVSGWHKRGEPSGSLLWIQSGKNVQTVVDMILTSGLKMLMMAITMICM